MARSFGNTGASSLVRAAVAGQSKVDAYNDAAASFEFDMSAKTQADYAKYKSYLDGRVAKVQASDPTKALSLTRTAVTANRTFNSAEIGRASDQVRQGNISNRDKYSQMLGLYNAAQQNGDSNLAQSLGNQLDTLSVTIQNEEKAQADAAVTAGNKAAAAGKKAYTDAIAKNEMGIKQLNQLRDAGKVTPSEYENQMAQFYQGTAPSKDNPQGTPGIATLVQSLAQQETANGDPYGTYNQKLNGDANIAKYNNGVGVAKKSGMDNSQTVMPNGDGTFSFHTRPNSEIVSSQPILDPKTGMPIPGSSSQTYAQPQAFTDKNGALNGFQFVSGVKNGALAPGSGPGAIYQYDNKNIFNNDPSGVGYIILPNGQKKFVGYEAKTDKAGNSYNQPVYANKPEDIKGMPGIKYGTDSKQTGKGPDALPGTTGFGPSGSILSTATNPASWDELGQNLTHFSNTNSIAGRILNNVPILNGILRRNTAAAQARQDAINLAAAQKQATARQASDALALAQQSKLLPVFRPPAPLAPPKITAAPSQYNLPALPAPIPLAGGSGVTTPAGTGNYQKDVLNLGRSLGGLL